MAQWQVMPLASDWVLVVDRQSRPAFIGKKSDARTYLDEALRCENEAEVAAYDLSGQSINPPGSGGQF